MIIIVRRYRTQQVIRDKNEQRRNRSRKLPRSAALFYCLPSWRNTVMAGPVTIASVRAHGVRRFLVYCNGKREGHWLCHHSGILPIDLFQADEVLSDIERQCRFNERI
jgi:hypothetical protein